MTPSGLKQRLIADQIALLYAKLPIALATVIVNGGLTAFLVWRDVPHLRVLTWLGVLILVCAARAASWLAYKRSRSRRLRATQWGLGFAIGAGVNGLVWGSVFWVFYDFLPPELHIFLVFVLGGMAAGAAASTSSYLPAFAAFTVPALSPMIVRLLGEDGVTYKVMGAMGIVYAVAMFALARDGGRVLKRANRLRIEKEDMAVALDNTSKLRVARLRALLNEATLAFVVADADTLIVQDASESALEFLRWDHPGLEDTTLGDLMKSVGVANFDSLFAHADGEFCAPVVKTLVFGDGRVVEARSSVHQFARGQHRLLILRDVTEGRQASEEAARSNLMDSLVTTAAGIAHEVNNPLATVMMSLDSLQRRIEMKDSEARQMLDDARSAAQAIRCTVRDLGELSNTPEGAERSTDIRAALEACVRTVFAGSHERSLLHMDLAKSSLPRVVGSRLEINQIFLNILANAVQAIPDNTRGAEKPIVVTAHHDPKLSRVRVEIRDSGVGVPPELGSRIFEPFVTSRPAGTGSGLGLTMSYRLVSKLGGTISFEGNESGGTTFSVFLPTAKIEVVPQELPSTNPPPELGADSSTRVLVVEDDILVARSLKWELERFNVTIVSSGEAALSKLGAESFDVVLCDVIMPEMNGTELFEHVQRRWPEVAQRFVFTTGGAVTESARAFVANSEVPCVLKPFERNELLATIERVAASSRS